MNLIEDTEDYYLYTVPIILNGKETNLRVAWIYDENVDEDFNGYYKILGTWDGINQENGMSSRELKPLRKGDVINIIQLYYNINTKEMKEMYSDDIVVDENTRIIESDLNTGDYLYSYNIEDIYIIMNILQSLLVLQLIKIGIFIQVNFRIQKGRKY